MSAAKLGVSQRLMQEMGDDSENPLFDTLPVAQRLHSMRHSKDPIEVLLNVLYGCSISNECRSAIAIDPETKKPVWNAFIEASTGWAEKTVRNVLWQAEKQGRIVRNFKREEITVRAKIIPKDLPEEGTEGESPSLIQGTDADISPDVLENINRLPDRDRRWALRLFQLETDYEREENADLQAAIRAKHRARRAAICQMIGIPAPKTLPQRRADGGTVEIALREVKFPDLASFVQSQESAPQTDPVQRTEAPPDASYNPVSSSVPAEHPISYREEEIRSSSSPVEAVPAITEEEEAAPETISLQAFRHRLIDLWNRKHKTVPVSESTATYNALDPEIRETWLDSLTVEQVKAWRHPGVMQGDARNFNESQRRGRQQQQQAARDRTAAALEEKRRQEEQVDEDQRREARYTEFATLPVETREPYLARAKQTLRADPRYEFLTANQRKEEMERCAASEYANEERGRTQAGGGGT
jgi:hypothetical protein